MGKNTECNRLLGILQKDRGSYEDMLDFVDANIFAEWLGNIELTAGIKATYSNFAEKTQLADKLGRREMDDFARIMSKIIKDSYEYDEVFLSYNTIFKKMEKTSLESLLQNLLSPDKDGNQQWMDIWRDRFADGDIYLIYKYYIISACIMEYLSSVINNADKRTRLSVLKETAVYRDEDRQDQSESAASEEDTQENEETAQEESPESKENHPEFKTDAEKELYQKFKSDSKFAYDMKFLVYDFASYIFQAARERSNELKEILEHIMTEAVSAIVLDDKEKEAIAKLVLKKTRYWDMCSSMMQDPIIADFITRISEPYQHVTTELDMKMEDLQLLLRHATMNAFFTKGGYFDETREEFKKKERYGQVVINTGKAQESNNSVPESQQAVSSDDAAQKPVNVVTDTRSNIMDEFNKFQAELKAAKQTSDDDITLYMTEYSYLTMKELGFDYAVYKVMIRDVKYKDKGVYKFNYSKAKRALEVIARFKHLPSMQGKLTDEEYVSRMEFTLKNLLAIMDENEFDDPEIKNIIGEIIEYHINKAADNSTVADEEATAANTGDDTSDEDEDFMEVDDYDYSAANDFGAKLQKATVKYDDDVKLPVPENLYKMAEEMGLIDDTVHIIETVNGTKLFNLSQYKRSWETICEAIKIGLRQIMPEKTINNYEEKIKNVITTILKNNGYDENGNKIAGYAVSNNAPLAVHEPAAPYGTVPPTSPVVSRPVAAPVQEDFGVFAPDKAESIDLPGITIRYNGRKVFISNDNYPYNVYKVFKLWRNDVDNGIVPKLSGKVRETLKINGHIVTNVFAFMHDKNDIVYKVEPAE